MKVKNFKLFLESNIDIDSICRRYDIENYTINEDGSIDVEGGVNLSGRGLTKLPLKFRNVSGHFICSNNQLTSLEGSPQSVGGNFYCYGNGLTSLRGGPRSVGGSFYCYGNKLKSLEGGPEFVVGQYHADENNIVDFRGFPEFYEEGIIDFRENPVQKILNQFPRNLWPSAIYWINEYDVIWNGMVNRERLDEVKGRLGLET